MNCDRCSFLETEIANLRSALQAAGEAEEVQAGVIGELERDLRIKRATITKLQREIDRLHGEDEHSEEAQEVYEFWRRLVSPKARAFKGKRRKAVLDRLKELEDGETVADRVATLKDAIRGAHVGAYVDPNGVRHDELELICRSDENVQKFVKRFEAWRARQESVQREVMRIEHERWLNTERVTVDPQGNLVPATPPPLHDLDTRSPAQRAFDAVILRHVMIARKRERNPPADLVEAEREAQQRITALNGEEQGGAVMRFEDAA